MFERSCSNHLLIEFSFDLFLIDGRRDGGFNVQAHPKMRDRLRGPRRIRAPLPSIEIAHTHSRKQAFAKRGYAAIPNSC